MFILFFFLLSSHTFVISTVGVLYSMIGSHKTASLPAPLNMSQHRARPPSMSSQRAGSGFFDPLPDNHSELCGCNAVANFSLKTHQQRNIS